MHATVCVCSRAHQIEALCKREKNVETVIEQGGISALVQVMNSGSGNDGQAKVRVRVRVRVGRFEGPKNHQPPKY